MIPEPDERPDPVRVDGSSRRSRRAQSIVVLAVAFLLVALVKPWGALETGDGAGPTVAATAPSIAVITASPTPAPSWPWDPNATSCLGPDGLVVVTLVRWPGHEVRTWQPAIAELSVEQAAVAAEPIIVRSSHVAGLGICRIETRSGSASTAAAQIVDVVQLGAGAPPGARRDLGAPGRISVDQPTPYLGVLYGPPAGAVNTGPTQTTPAAVLSPAASATPDGDASSWAPGSYAVGIQFPSRGPATLLWVALTVVPATGEPG